MFKQIKRSIAALTAIESKAGLFAVLALFSVLLFALHSHASDDFLDPERAFRFSAKMENPEMAEITYAIADGYYMYRERFGFKAEGATLGDALIPPGKIKFDETFQRNVEIYRKSVTIKVPVRASGAFTLRVTGQGCADKGLCYAPMESQAKLSPKGVGLLAMLSGAPDAISAMSERGYPLLPAAEGLGKDSEMGRIEASLKSGRLVVILPLFLLLGLGLSFTPCVLPMVPILSSIIVGEGARISRGRGFALSAAYSTGLAIVYTMLGIAAGLAGEGLSAALQNPWILSVFALLIVGLSLSMFDVYQLQVPAVIQAKLMKVSARQSGGKLFGVFVMGAISALIVGPCVAAPLAGTLLYISQTRDVLIGGSALFAMAVGMSVPLILVGISAGALLPRAGAWMRVVKNFFGVLMLGLALWIVTPVLPSWMPMVGWATLALACGTYLLWMPHWGKMSNVFGVLLVALGLVQLVGVATGARDVLAPLAHLSGSGTHVTQFKKVKSVAELESAIAQAQGKTVMLDFYADWCVSCKEMEKLTFNDNRVQSQFANMLLLQADVTANDADDRALLKHFKLFGPPGIIFFDRQGREIPGGRVIGYQNADKFLHSLTLVNSF